MNVKQLVENERRHLEEDGYTIYKEEHGKTESLLIMFRDRGPEDHGGQFKIITFDADPTRLGDMRVVYVYVNLARQKVEMFATKENVDESL